MLTKVPMGWEMLVPVERLPSKLHSLSKLQQRSSTKSSAMEGVIPDSTQLKPHLTFEVTVHLPTKNNQPVKLERASVSPACPCVEIKSDSCDLSHTHIGRKASKGLEGASQSGFLLTRMRLTVSGLRHLGFRT